MSKVALFAGSFDPFTLGHKDIVDRALSSIADEVIIAIGYNCQKTYAVSVEQRMESIRSIYNNDKRVCVEAYQGLTTDYAQSIHADFLLRGVRSIKDFEYERDIAEVNKRLAGIETVLMFTSPQLACISSSVVRELQSYGKDVSEFLPSPINSR